jgi:hypothetical protein
VRVLVIAVLTAGLTAYGSSSSAKYTYVSYGRTGGNIKPERIFVRAVGKVGDQVRATFGSLTSRECPGTLPDMAIEYISFGGRTVRVRGGCEPAFAHLWNTLSGS